MSITAPRADTRRRCFRPCRPGAFCRCLGRTIARRASKCGVCNGTGFASSIAMHGRICDECRGSGEAQ